LIDPVTGDFEDYAACPTCKETSETLEAQTHKYHAALAEITRLKKDPQAEAEKHKLYAEGEAVHTWWRLATWHPQTKFEHVEFYQALPRLKERGPVELLKAIAGAAFEPGSKTYKNGEVEVYDSWELICRSKSKCDSFAKRAYPSPNGENWKRWLVQRIETNLGRQARKERDERNNDQTSQVA
jgi:hypothetical protein